MEPTFAQALEKCITLQKKLKDEYLLLSTEQDQKVILEKKLSTYLQNYYRNLVHLDHNPRRRSNSYKNLFED